MVALASAYRLTDLSLVYPVTRGLALSSAEAVAAAPTVDGHGFHNGLVICVGNGGPTACRWTIGHRRSRPRGRRPRRAGVRSGAGAPSR